MAAMTTVLKKYSDNGNSWKYTIPASHTASKPRMVLQRRREPTGNQVMLELSTTVMYGTTDALGLILPQKASFEVITRRPINGTLSDFTAAWATFADIIVGDEWQNTYVHANPIQ